MNPSSNPASNQAIHPLQPEALADLAALAKKQAHRAITKIAPLGSVAWLMMQQTAGRQTLLGELEWRVMPALMLDQAKLYMKDEAPVAFASWARLSEDVARRFQTAPYQLALSDWASGDQVWLIDVLTPFGGAQDVLKNLRETVFAGQELRQLLPVGLKAQVMVWPATGRRSQSDSGDVPGDSP